MPTNPWQKENPFKIGIFKWQSESVMKLWTAAALEYIEKNGEEPKKDRTEMTRVKGMYKDIRVNYLKQLKQEEQA
jgi:hypothetical protein